MTTFTPYRACKHNIGMVYLKDHSYDAEGKIIDDSSVYISFGRLPDDLQLLVIPFIMRTMTGLEECASATASRGQRSD